MDERTTEVTVTVTVPDDVYAGDAFIIEYEGLQLSVVCPDGCWPGDAINLAVPVQSEDCVSQVTVVVPDDCWPGDEFAVEFNGRTFNIGVPEGCGPGDELTVDAPEVEGDQPVHGKQWASEAEASAPEAAANYKFQPGQRVELLRSDGAFSPGTVVMGFEGVFDVMYKVKLDNGLFKEAVPEEELSEELCEPGDLFDGL